MQKKSHTKRLPGLDISRGIMVSIMIIYHAFYLLANVFGVISPMENTLLSRILTGAGGAIFIFIAGTSGALAYESISKKGGNFFLYCFKRFLILSALALSVSGLTYYFEPNEFIRFGILHFFAIGFLLLPLFSRTRWTNLVMALLMILIGSSIYSLTFEIENLWIFGIRSISFLSADYYPIFPYFGVMLLGFFLGKEGIENGKIQHYFGWDFRGSSFVRWLGRNSLMVYIIHVPALYGVFWLIFGK